MAHARVIRDNIETLLRCTNVNVHVIACLKAYGCLTEDQVSEIVAEQSLRSRSALLYKWMQTSIEAYKCFVQVMEENQQEHVSNLLKGKTNELYLPLCNKTYQRLDRIKPKLMFTIYLNEELTSNLKSKHALSETDYQDIKYGKTQPYEQNWALITAIQRRSEYSLRCLKNALLETYQADAADCLEKGDIIAMHLHTNRPEIEDQLSTAINRDVSAEFSSEYSAVSELSEHGVHLVGARPDKSILLYFYCSETMAATVLAKSYSSGLLKSLLDSMLDRLLSRAINQAMSSALNKLETNLSFDLEEALLIEEITGLDVFKTKKHPLEKEIDARFELKALTAALRRKERKSSAMNEEEGRYIVPSRQISSSSSQIFSVLIETPQNVAVYVGQRMSFECITSKGSTVREWLFNRSSNSEYLKLINTWMVTGQTTVLLSPYGIKTDASGSGELFLNDTQMNDAGKYSCLAEVNDTLTYYHAELIVLESEPICNLTDDAYPSIQAECGVNFSGNQVPNMSWIFDKATLYVERIDAVVSKTRVSSTLKAVVVNSAKKSFALYCKTYFERQNGKTLSNDSASNVPQLVYVWDAAKEEAKGISKAGPHLLNRSTVTTLSSEESGNIQYKTFMYVVVALALALVVSMTATLVCVCRRRKNNATLADKTAMGDDEETKAKERIYSGFYDTIDYDAIGYETPDRPVSSDQPNRGYDLPVKDGVPSGYDEEEEEEGSGEELNAKDKQPIVLSSQSCITSMPYSANENGGDIVSSDDNKSRGKDNKYTTLSSNDARKQEPDKKFSVEKERSSYLEIIDDED